MTRRIALVLAATCCACALPSSPPAPAPPGRGLDAEERAVLAAVARELGGDAPFVVVADSTYGAEWTDDIRSGLVGYAQLDPGMVDQIGRDYTARNAVSTAIPADLSPEMPIRTYSWRAFESDPLHHDEIRARFARAGWLHRISRPGFDARRTTAVVWRSFWCEGLCGYSGMLILRRESAGWRVVKGMPLTIS